MARHTSFTTPTEGASLNRLLAALFAIVFLAGFAHAAEPTVSALGVLLQDEGTLKGRARTLNCIGAGISCDVTGGVGSLTVSSGGGGSPGGAANSVQYNNAS